MPSFGEVLGSCFKSLTALEKSIVFFCVVWASLSTYSTNSTKKEVDKVDKVEIKEDTPPTDNKIEESDSNA